MGAAERRIDIEMLIDLGLPKVDKTATRQMVRNLFKAYRHSRLILDMVMVPHAPEAKAKQGYANAMDPDLIRVERVHGGAPRGFGSESMVTDLDRRRMRFVDDVERRVARLPQYQRDLVEHHYMQPETPGGEARTPSDANTYMHLRNIGWYVSERYYDEEKAKAIMTLAEAFRVVRFEEFQHNP